MAENNQSNNQLILYRFVSLRSPELSKSENQNNRFVFFNLIEKGEYAKSLENEQSIEFKGLKTEEEIKAVVNETFFNFTTWLANNKSKLKPNEISDEINTKDVKTLKTEEEAILWDNLFYQVKEAENFRVKEVILEMLVAQNLLNQKKNEGFNESFLVNLADAQVVLPVELFGGKELSLHKQISESTDTETDADPKQGFVPKGYGYFSLGIADYRKVVSEVCCYQAGEVAHIENVMAREIREKITTKVHSSEITQTDSTEIETEKLSDNVSTERFQMQTEIANILQEQKQFSVNAHVNQSWGSGSFDLSASYANNTSKEDSNRQAVTKGKDITNRAMERIVSRIKSEKIVKITDTFTEVNKHGYDNTKGDENRSGVYRNVNAIYRNQIHNYGKRLMFEFSVPQPSKIHREALKSSRTNGTGAILEKPENPRVKIEDLIGKPNFDRSDANILINIARKYNANFNDYPQETIAVSKTLINSDPQPRQLSIGTVDFDIPENYYSNSFGFTYTGLRAGANARAIITFGDTRFSYDLQDLGLTITPNELNKFGTDYTDSVSFAYQAIDHHTINLNVTLYCQISEQGKQKWKNEIYQAILEGYEEQLRKYNENLSQVKAEQQQNLESNPLFFRQIEQLVLRKNCISYLIDDKNPNSKRKFGLDMYEGDELKNIRVKSSKELDDYSGFVKFIEQAFEWDLMSYSFYPFYWGNEEDWGELYNYDCNDPLFRSFMQAGLARVVVTVRTGFENAVMFYLKTGKIWNGGQVPIIGHQLYLSIVDELKEEPYTVEETWETVVPTNLIALQKDNELPCSCEGHNKLVLPNLLAKEMPV